MPTFDYSAYDAKGKLVDGVVTADSERQARRQLKEKKTARFKANRGFKIFLKV